MSDGDSSDHSEAAASDYGLPEPNYGDRSPFLRQTVFDAYFLQTAKSSKTSHNVFTDLVTPLTQDEYAAAISPALLQSVGRSAEHVLGITQFAQYLRELDSGFNLLFYGFGSKRDALNKFAREACITRGHVVVVQAFRPEFTLKDLLAAVERVPGILARDLPTSGVDGQSQRIRAFFTAPDTRPLYLIIHNIEAPALRTARARACLSLIALAPRLHLVASVDHINAPMLWSTSECSTRKPVATNLGANEGSTPIRGYAWLWHDLTTLAPYDTELAFADRSSISGAVASATAKAGAAQNGPGSSASMAAMSESAAQHVLASVTQKAKKLFVIMAQQQLTAMEDAGPTAGANGQDFAIGYDALFNLARDNFVATTDGALRSLLGEYRDHGLVQSTVTGGAGGREGLWIPLRKERLGKLLQLVKADQFS